MSTSNQREPNQREPNQREPNQGEPNQGEPKIGVIGANGRMGTTICNLYDKIEVAVIGDIFKHCLTNPDEISKTTPNIDKETKDAYSTFLKNFKHPLKTLTIDKKQAFQNCDIIIDFSAPECTLECAELNTKFNKLLVSGTTGFNDKEKEQLQEYGKKSKIIWASNTSIGVNILFDLSKKLSKIFGTEYDAEILERHHSMKKDSPSGTALTLGEKVAEGRGTPFADVANFSREQTVKARQEGEIGFQVARHGTTIGYHELNFWGKDERFWIGHEAFTRDIFAKGAIRLAAEGYRKLKDNGLYSFSDIFNIL